MSDSYGPGSHLRVRLAEQDRVSALREESLEIARCIEEKLRAKLGLEEPVELSVSIDLDEDWPYVLNLEVSARSSGLLQDLEEILYNVVDECVEAAAKRLEERGLEELY